MGGEPSHAAAGRYRAMRGVGGTDAAAIVRYTNFAARTDKTFYLLDTFRAFGGTLDADEIAIGAASAQWLYKQLGDLYASVVERFAATRTCA